MTDNTAPPEITDEQLVKSAQNGDREAFITLYNRYLRRVYNRVKSRVPSERDAEDVTQEVFIAVVRSLDRFEQRSRFSTWLYTIVNRQIADFYRRMYRGDDQHALSLDMNEQYDLAAEDDDLEDMLVVQQALNQLPENYQEVVLMRFADGLSFAEIADELGKSVEAVKSLYRRAIQAMTEHAERKVKYE